MVAAIAVAAMAFAAVVDALWTRSKSEQACWEWGGVDSVALPNPKGTIAGCTALIRTGGGRDAYRLSLFSPRAIAYAQIGEHDRALADLDQILRFDPSNAHAHYLRGNAYAGKGDHDRALRTYDEAIRLAPSCAACFADRGRSYRDKGQLDRAIQDFDEAIRLESAHRWQPTLPFVFHDRGTAYYGKRRYDRAILDFNEAISLYPYPFFFSNRAVAYAAKGDHDRAFQDDDWALARSSGDLKSDSRDAAALYTRGIVRQRRGDIAGGAADMDAARAMDVQAVRWLQRHGVR
jgi:tetratricopeptide (TPR) repeat protein